MKDAKPHAMNYEIKPRLGDLLHDRDMTQSHLADISGIKQGTISRIVNGNQRYKLEHLFRIADALDVRIEDLFDVKRTERTD